MGRTSSTMKVWRPEGMRRKMLRKRKAAMRRAQRFRSLDCRRKNVSALQQPPPAHEQGHTAAAQLCVVQENAGVMGVACSDF
jgi:hypothetical protein